MAKRKWGESTPRCCLSLKLQCERIYMPVPPVLARRTRSFIYLRHLVLWERGAPAVSRSGARTPRRNDMFHGRLGTPEARYSREISCLSPRLRAQLRVNSPGEFPEKCQRQEFPSVLAKFEGKQARFSENIPSSVSFSSAASAVHT